MMRAAPRILIAEDDAMQSALLQAAMTERGYETVTVVSGLDAIRRLRQERFDVALLDYHLPDIDGLAAARLMQDHGHEHGAARHQPQMIALTAAADQLAARPDDPHTSFHAVVAKQHGLPAVMAVIDDHLAIAAHRHAAIDAARGREAAFQRAQRRRQRLTAPLAAIPALIVSGVFAVGLLHTAVTLPVVGKERLVAAQATVTRHNATTILDAMADTQMVGVTYLATGDMAQKERFYAQAERLDRTLTSQASLRPDGLPGAGADTPQTVTDPMLRQMAEAVEHRMPMAEAVLPLQPLRIWADRLAASSETMLQRGLDTIRANILVALLTLGFGVAYGLWNAVSSVRRRWNAPLADTVRMQAASGYEHMLFPKKSAISTSALVSENLVEDAS